MTISNAATPVASDPRTGQTEPPATGGPRRTGAAAPPTQDAAGAPHLPGAERDGERASDAAEQASAGAAAALPEFRLQQLSIRKHPDLDRVIVQVIDSRTGEVIRQIPPEEWVQVLESMHAAKGVLVDREG